MHPLRQNHGSAYVACLLLSVEKSNQIHVHTLLLIISCFSSCRCCGGVRVYSNTTAFNSQAHWSKAQCRRKPKWAPPPRNYNSWPSIFWRPFSNVTLTEQQPSTFMHLYSARAQKIFPIRNMMPLSIREPPPTGWYGGLSTGSAKAVFAFTISYGCAVYY